MDMHIADEMLARAIGWEVIAYLQQEETLETIRKEVNGDALRVLEQIQCILNNDKLDDPECFQRIDRIAETFYAYGISASRNDW